MTTLGINTFSHYRRTEGRPLVGGRWLVNSILPLFPVTYLLGMLTWHVTCWGRLTTKPILLSDSLSFSLFLCLSVHDRINTY